MSTPYGPYARRGLTSGPVATRMEALDFAFMGLLLPNPDPILKATGKDIKTYRELARDSHVGACIRRRKGAVAAMEWGVDAARSPARVAKAIKAMLDRLDMARIICDALEATLFGYAPMEIDWRAGGGGPFAGVWPADVVALPPEWFCFDSEGALRFKTRSSPLYGELLPERKFLLPRQDATYHNPYGLGDLALCYWPVVFKKGSMRFWLAFAEKFGAAFSIGKLPRSADAAERAALLADLEALIQDGVAVIPDDGSVELVEAAGKTASSDLYERLVMYCRSEISIVLTGTNQTVEVTSNKASASAGMDVADDLRDANARLVEGMINQLIGWAVQINWPGAEAPVFNLWDQEARDRDQAARDKSNFDAGARFSRSYWIDTYGYKESDLAEVAAPSGPALPPGTPAAAGNAGAAAVAAFAAGDADPPDPTAAEQAALAAAAAPSWQAMMDELAAVVEAAPDLATLQRRLTDAYGGLDTDELVRIMSAALALAELKGMAAAREDGGVR
ncbi:MAG: DUF935 domain-containing protein [Burkholderiaceae bacterium]|jgi:phage gp29-like protein|nr:DUF935 domain-containing protein [Burkholderiaceae bacterium]